MISYHDYEKKVYDWLLSKREKDNEFTFSLRQMANKGSENDYFIGTSKSNYFGTTFWKINVGFPGSSGDCINLIFMHKGDKFQYKYEFKQTNSPSNEQNKSALNLLKHIQQPLKDGIGLRKDAKPENKMFSMVCKPQKKQYESIDAMIEDVSHDLEIILPIVDEGIIKEKQSNPDFVAHRITSAEFQQMQDWMQERFEKFENLDQMATDDDSQIKQQKESVNQIGDSEESYKKVINAPLNQILYGPPGTGKTYNTLLKAAEIVANREVKNYEEAKDIFNQHLGDQIEFITFHQNYSYEDFIQGLRPDIDNGDSLTFDRKDGLFKLIADRALKNLINFERPPSNKLPFEKVFNEFFSELIEGDVSEIEIPMKKVSYYVTGISTKSIEFRKDNGVSNHTLSITTLKKMYDLESVMDIQGLSSYYRPLLGKLLELGKDSNQPLKSEPRKDYVIVIDEINRANISRVFGELITLIEPDKRSHGAIPMKCTLPSGEDFTVPSNLYIIGTMNTADKSIALLDIALRRRFIFEAMYPKYEINGSTIHDSDILERINKEIIKSKGHDFQIGHSYFMNVKEDLIYRMNYKVIPLLLEYYMNDEKEVENILKTAGLEVDTKSWPLKIIGRVD